MAGGLILSIFLLAHPSRPPARGAWLGLTGLAAVALCATAVLRWSS